MKKLLLTTAALLAIALPVFALDAAEREQVRAELIQLRKAAMQTPEFQAKRQAMAEADQAYTAAVKALPEVQAVDREIEQLRRRMMQLQLLRRDAVDKSQAQLAQRQQTRDTARAAFRTVAEGSARARELQSQLLGREEATAVQLPTR